MRAPIRCTFFRDCHDRYGRAIAASWSNLAARCSRHDQGEKDGPALTCCTFQPGQPRGNRSVVARTLIALDIETNRKTGEVPPAFASTRDNLTIRRVLAVMWTTHGHTPELPRYRVLMPLARAIDYQPDIDPYLTASVAAQLNLHGVSDASKFGAASLFYLPRHPEAGAHATAVITGEPIDSGMLLTMATTIAQGVAQTEAEVLARRQAHALPPDVIKLVARFNELHPVARTLERYGYRRDGGRWRSRYQHGQGATTVLSDGMTWVSFSESDAAAGVGRRPLLQSSQCACFGDSFALFVHYEYDGDFRSALASLKAGVGGAPAAVTGPHHIDGEGDHGHV
jgi:hypothetical protein